MAYSIETYDERSRAWTTDGIGESTGWTRAAASKAMRSLPALGPDWASSRYRVVNERTGEVVDSLDPMEVA